MILLASLALAADLPAPPAVHAAVEGECRQQEPVRLGERPVFVGLDGKATCRGVLVPTSVYAGLLDAQDDAQLVRNLYEVDAAAWAAEGAAAEERSAYWKALAEKPSPSPVGPVVYVGLGVVGGIGVTLASAWALSLVEGG